MTNTNPLATGSPKHEDGTSSTQPPSSNPSGGAFNVVVSVPATIEIKMVDASALAEYEIWFFIASIVASAAIGFLVAFVQAIDGKSAASAPEGWMDMVLFVLFFLSVGTALYKRSILKKKGRDIKLTTSVASI